MIYRVDYVSAVILVGAIVGWPPGRRTSGIGARTRFNRTVMQTECVIKNAEPPTQRRRRRGSQVEEIHLVSCHRQRFVVHTRKRAPLPKRSETLGLQACSNEHERSSALLQWEPGWSICVQSWPRSRTFNRIVPIPRFS